MPSLAFIHMSSALSKDLKEKRAAEQARAAAQKQAMARRASMRRG